MTKENNTFDDSAGARSLRTGVPCGEYGCPHCGITSIGMIQTVCGMCGNDIFAHEKTPALLNNVNMMEIPRFDKILQKVIARSCDWREGQGWFNYFYEYYPEQANLLRGTKYDCFYVDDKIESFLLKIKELINESGIIKENS